jgi:small subunit ribosomal protein S16e
VGWLCGWGEQKTATAVAYVKEGRGLIKINGAPIANFEPQILLIKAMEPILLLKSQDVFSKVRLSGGASASS